MLIEGRFSVCSPEESTHLLAYRREALVKLVDAVTSGRTKNFAWVLDALEGQRFNYVWPRGYLSKLLPELGQLEEWLAATWGVDNLGVDVLTPDEALALRFFLNRLGLAPPKRQW